MDFNNSGNENNNRNNYNNENNNYNSGNHMNGNHNINNNMGNSPYGYPYTPPYIVPGKKLANAAMALGILSIVSTILMTIYIPLILGSIAIVLAILSKGVKPHMVSQAMTGLVCGIGGLIMNIGILAASLMFIFSHPDVLRDAAKTYDAQFERIYGESTEDMLGQSLEDMVNEMFGLE